MIPSTVAAAPGPGLPLGLPLDPPLDPSGDDARSSLRRELAKPEYQDANLLERLQDWLVRQFDSGVNRISGLDTVPTLALVLLAVGLLVALTLLVSRFRRSGRARGNEQPALGDERVSAKELRARADAAMAAGRWDDAVVDGFRALAVRQVERGRIEDLPQATAHELARSLGSTFAGQRERIDGTADVFDAVLYGDHAATREQAAAVLALDDELGSRVVRR